MRKNVTIMDVARDCGLSKSTVAYALNGSAKGKVSSVKREIVKKSALKLGYRPNFMAQSLRNGKTNSIGLLWSLSGPHDSLGLVRNISIRLMHKGYACHVADSLSDPGIVERCLMDFRSRNVDGLIIQIDEKLLKNKEILNLLREIQNVVVVAPETVENQFDNLIIDRTQAIRDIVDHFVATGRKQLTLLSTTDSGREHAFREQIKLHNLPYSEDSIIHVETNHDGDYSSSIRWLYFVDTVKNKFNGQIPFDALICSTDEAASAVISYLYESGYKVPEDIAVSGFNNSGMAAYFRPPLASVDRQNQESAENITEMLLNRIKTPALPPQNKKLEMKFIHRKSAG